MNSLNYSVTLKRSCALYELGEPALEFDAAERQDVSARTEREFAGEPTSPAAARNFAKQAVGGLLSGPTPQALCDDLELVVSELVTNAVRAGSPTIGVSVDVERGRVVVRVRDRAGGWPQERQARLDDVGGRGLPLVSALSAAWGVQLADDGKVVWAELDVPSES